MDLEARKYYIIQELFSIQNESVIGALEQVLQRVKAKGEDISNDLENELDRRSESYKDNPDEVLDWKDVRNDW